MLIIVFFLSSCSPFVVDETLFAPAKTIPYDAVGNHESKHFLLVDADDETQGITDFDVLSNVMAGWIATEDFHRTTWHRCCRLLVKKKNRLIKLRKCYQRRDVNINGAFLYLEWQRLQHRYSRLIVRNDFVSSLVAAPDMETSALVRHQLQMRLDDYRVEIFDTTIVLKHEIQKIVISKIPALKIAR